LSPAAQVRELRELIEWAASLPEESAEDQVTEVASGDGVDGER
jgi:actin-like ATPase involved in cell morphogenesis